MPQVADPLRAQADGLVGFVERYAREWNREDLVAQLQDALPRRSGAAVTVVVCGETKRGKSALINAVLGRPALLPVSAEESTAIHVMVRACRPTEPEGALAHVADGEPVRVPLAELDDWVTDRAPPDRGVLWVEVSLDHPLLAEGVVLVDTPGVGGLARAHGKVALAALSGAEAALLVVDANAPISAPELEFLSAASERVGDRPARAQQGGQPARLASGARRDRGADRALPAPRGRANAASRLGAHEDTRRPPPF